MLRSEHQQRVDQFHVLAQQGLPALPAEPSEEVRLLRAKLIFEEAMETIRKGLGIRLAFGIDGNAKIREEMIPQFDIVGPFNMIETIDGCCDLKVVTTGTLTACGIPDEPFQKLVDENNLAKFGPGHYVADNTTEKPGPVGKLIKPPRHTPPDIAGMLIRIFRFFSEPRMTCPTNTQLKCDHSEWLASSPKPRNCLNCGLLMWDAGD